MNSRIEKLIKQRNFDSKIIEANSQRSKSYQELLTEEKHCRKELKKQQMWAYGCLLVGWIVLLMGKLSNQLPYNHPIFAIPIFGLIFLAATSSWEKEHELDMRVARCVVAGVKVERKNPSLNSNYFNEFLDSFRGWGMWQFAFVRVSPVLMIIFSFFNTGAFSFLSRYSSISMWIVNSIVGGVLGLAFVSFAKFFCRPYYWMIAKANETLT